MCGIAGTAGRIDSDDSHQATVRSMIATLAHRGPDGFGYFSGPGIAFAHARLSIIDLETGDQPISNEDGSVMVMLNGEIFNFVELRDELEKAGHRFSTRSDTEVIVHLYEDHGLEFVHRLNGQFAIALWDSRLRRLVLARDRVGIRPLYYCMDRGRIWFASEIKALLAARPEIGRLNPLGLAQALTFWSAVDPTTVFSGVESLPAGSLLEYRPGQPVRIHRYWDWDFADESQDPEPDVDAIAADLRDLLIDSVRLQLRADVPVGAYLSGGLDSSGIVSLIRSFTSAPLRTFSIAFAESEFDESEHQRAMVKYLGTDHTTVQCSNHDIGAAFPHLIYHAETPLVRTGPVPLMLLSARVRAEGYKVVLTGEGADEVFGGYDIFKEAKIRRFWARQPDSRMRPLLLRRLYPYLVKSPVASAAFAKTFFAQGMEYLESPVFAHIPRWNTSARACGFLSAEWRSANSRWDPPAWMESQIPARVARWSPLCRDQYVEAKTLLAGYLLSSQGDRAAMANSIEGRVPYLDHRVVEYAARLPSRLKLRVLQEKHVLRLALRGMLPDDILRRRKQPYRAPDIKCFFKGDRALDYVEDLTSAERIRAAGYFDAASVGRLVDKCRAGRAVGFADNQAFVGILSTMLVDELFVRRNQSLSTADMKNG
ncbi:MAG: asparagine synthase (glutamine-hydrolyzing) [Burkholderiales bacterium]